VILRMRLDVNRIQSKLRAVSLVSAIDQSLTISCTYLTLYFVSSFLLIKRHIKLFKFIVSQYDFSMLGQVIITINTEIFISITVYVSVKFINLYSLAVAGIEKTRFIQIKCKFNV